MTDHPRCATCKHWEQDRDGDEARMCAVLTAGSVPGVEPSAWVGYDDPFYSLPTFYCFHHEPPPGEDLAPLPPETRP